MGLWYHADVIDATSVAQAAYLAQVTHLRSSTDVGGGRRDMVASRQGGIVPLALRWTMQDGECAGRPGVNSRTDVGIEADVPA